MKIYWMIALTGLSAGLAGCEYVLPVRPVLGYENNDDTCSDERDNDEDGLIDCEDPDCDGQVSVDENNTPGFCEYPGELTCDDNFDNDGDGTTDCDDSNCSQNIDCASTTVEDCNNDIDDDSDGMIDCQDSDCDGFPSVDANNMPGFCEFGSETDCTDGFDNDGDGDAD